MSPRALFMAGPPEGRVSWRSAVPARAAGFRLWPQAALAIEMCQRAAEIAGPILPGSYRSAKPPGCSPSKSSEWQMLKQLRPPLNPNEKPAV